MVYYLIICRSLTYAQRTAAALSRAGIAAHLLRTPASLGERGCSYSVKIAHRRLAQALQTLKRAGVPVERIYITQGDGSYKEVEL